MTPKVHDQEIAKALDFVDVGEDAEIRPLGEMLLIEALALPEATRGGIIVPERMHGRHDFSLFRVVAVGDGWWDRAGVRHEHLAKPGDVVILGGAKYELPFRGRQLGLVHMSHILAIVDRLPAPEQWTAPEGRTNGTSRLIAG